MLCVFEKKQQFADKKLGRLRVTASLSGQRIAVVKDTNLLFSHLSTCSKNAISPPAFCQKEPGN